MPNDNQAREKIEEILEGREYTVYYEDSKGIIETWLEKALEWFINLLVNWFPSLEPTSGFIGMTFFVIIIVLIAILLIIFFVVARHVRRNHKYRSLKPLTSINEMKWSYQKHRSEAQKQEGLENYIGATRHLFLALLLYFDELSWLETRIWKTNWDYYEELRKVNLDGAALYNRFALLFDRVTYGERDVSKVEYYEFRDEVMKWIEATDEARAADDASFDSQNVKERSSKK